MDEIIADFLTKPLQGKAFVKFWDLLMGAVWLYFKLDFRYGALVGTQVHHRSVGGIVAGITKLREQVGERVEKIWSSNSDLLYTSCHK
jgi:hypothetical protein